MKFLHTHLRGHFHNKKHNRFDLLFLFVAPGSDVDVFVCLFSFFNFTFCSRWLRFFSIILFTKNLYIIVLNYQLEMTQNKRRLCRTSIYIVTFRATVKILFDNWQNIDGVIHLPTNKFPKSDMASVSSLSLLVVEGLKTNRVSYKLHVKKTNPPYWHRGVWNWESKGKVYKVIPSRLETN